MTTSKKSKEHYVSNKDFLAAMIEYKKMVVKAEKEKIQRSARLRKYIEYADKKNLIDEMDAFIRSIPEGKWHHFYEE